MFEVGQIVVSKFNAAYEAEIIKINEKTGRISYKPVVGSVTCLSEKRFESMFEPKWVPDTKAKW